MAIERVDLVEPLPAKECKRSKLGILHVAGGNQTPIQWMNQLIEQPTKCAVTLQPTWANVLEQNKDPLQLLLVAKDSWPSDTIWTESMRYTSLLLVGHPNYQMFCSVFGTNLVVTPMVEAATPSGGLPHLPSHCRSHRQRWYCATHPGGLAIWCQLQVLAIKIHGMRHAVVDLNKGGIKNDCTTIAYRRTAWHHTTSWYPRYPSNVLYMIPETCVI